MSGQDRQRVDTLPYIDIETPIAIGGWVTKPQTCHAGLQAHGKVAVIIRERPYKVAVHVGVRDDMLDAAKEANNIRGLVEAWYVDDADWHEIGESSPAQAVLLLIGEQASRLLKHAIVWEACDAQ